MFFVVFLLFAGDRDTDVLLASRVNYFEVTLNHVWVATKKKHQVRQGYD